MFSNTLIMPKFLYLNMKADFKCGGDKLVLDSFTLFYCKL